MKSWNKMQIYMLWKSIQASKYLCGDEDYKPCAPTTLSFRWEIWWEKIQILLILSMVFGQISVSKILESLFPPFSFMSLKWLHLICNTSLAPTCKYSASSKYPSNHKENPQDREEGNHKQKILFLGQKEWNFSEEKLEEP